MVKAEWRTDRDNPLASLQVLGFTELEHWQILAFDFQQRHVGTWIGTDQLGFHFAAIGQADEDFVSIGDHVIIGQDIAIGRDDETRTQGGCLALTVTR
ncbi:hypothetical protein D3C75_442860 [compost metagenome]